MLSKITAAATFANTLMLIAITFNVNLNKYIIPSIFIMIFIMWVVGWVCEITGIRKRYREAEFRNVKIETQGKIQD